MSEGEQLVKIAQQSMATFKWSELTKAGIDNIASIVQNAIALGYMDPVDTFIHVKKMEKLAEELKKQVQPYATGDLNLAKGEIYERMSTEISERDSTRYDYSKCNDPVLRQLLKEQEELKEEVTNRQEYLKNIKNPVEVVDSDTGEVVTIFPAVRKSSPGLVIRIK